MKIRDCLFSTIETSLYLFEVISKENGVLAGSINATNVMHELCIKYNLLIGEGENLNCGSVILRGIACPQTIVKVEERILGVIGKTSGVATAAQKALKIAKGKVKVVCGAWKKVDPTMRQHLREAVECVGMSTKIAEPPFVYLDKNYIRLLGGIKPAIDRAKLLVGHKIVIQLHKICGKIQAEAHEALEAGGNILMIDTGSETDLNNIVKIVKKSNKRNVEVAFSGDVQLNDIQKLSGSGVNILDIGRAIVDAPMLDLSLDVKGRYDVKMEFA